MPRPGAQSTKAKGKKKTAKRMPERSISRRQILRASLASLVEPALIFGWPDQAKVYETPEEAYAVYSAALNGRDGKEERFLIASETYPFKACLPEENQCPLSLVPALRDYKEKVNRKWSISRKFSVNKPYDLLSSKCSACLKVRNSFKPFRTQTDLLFYPRLVLTNKKRWLLSLLVALTLNTAEGF
jgi:hypothetical protein